MMSLKKIKLNQVRLSGITFYFFLFLLFLVVPVLLFAQASPPTPADLAVRKAADFEKIPRVAVPRRPFLFLNKDEIEDGRARASKEAWAEKVKEDYLKLADAWISRDYDFIKAIIPAWGSIYVYGLGKDLDPVHQKKMKWPGWDDPFHVIAEDGTKYPNAGHPDDGMGWTDPVSKEKYYFKAYSNGRIIKQLETIELLALVNTYVLTGNEAYAEKALWILDAIATIYPRANEGPVDYPNLAPGKADGGRLDRPYYQAARALMNYAYFAEVLSQSVHANKPSRSNAASGYSMMKNIELNLLMNGADYCLRMAQQGTVGSTFLTNGSIDYNRAPLVVGALLGITEWVDWALNSPIGFRRVISNAIDVNGRYFETSTLYSDHTRKLLLNTSWFLKRMKLPGYPEGYNAYNDLKFAKFALNFFTDIQVAGRLPLFGDSGPDNLVKNGHKIFDRGTLRAAKEFYNFSENKEVHQLALEAGSLMLKNMPAVDVRDSHDLFKMYDWEGFVKKAGLVKGLQAAKRNALFFDAGTLILRSGTPGENERAALLRFGPTLNHGHADELGLNFYARGREFSFDPGYYNTHLRFGFTTTTVAHNILVANRTNQLRWPSPGGDLQTWTDGEVLKSASVNSPKAYASQKLTQYQRRIALIDLSADESYIIDNFWAAGASEYDYSLHGITQGKFQILSDTKSTLKQKRTGSVLSPVVDYPADMDLNGRVTSFTDAPFYFAPPGAGFGFLSNPAFYSFKNPIQMQWSATDATGHQMYVWQFAPSSSELIVAKSPQGPLVLSSEGEKMPLDLTYTLAHVKVPVSKPVNFMSVILQTGGENKLAEVKKLSPKDPSQQAFAYHIRPASDMVANAREHFYFVSDQRVENVLFDSGIGFSGEEGFLGLDAAGNVTAASLTGAGYIKKGSFRFTVKPLLAVPLRVMQIQENPLRILVNISHAQCRQLEGSIVRLNRKGLVRPFVLRVNKSEAAGKNTWLTMDASGNTFAEGTIRNYDSSATHSILTDAPFPHVRPYVYTFSEKTGLNAPDKGVDYTYNGGYNGFWFIVNQQPGQKLLIENMLSNRTRIKLEKGSGKVTSGDQFKIQLLAPGDLLEVPVWGQAKRGADGKWQAKGPAKVEVSNIK